MKLEVVVDASGLPLGLAAAAADVSENELLMPDLDDVPVEVPHDIPVSADKGFDSTPYATNWRRRAFDRLFRTGRNECGPHETMVAG